MKEAIIWPIEHLKSTLTAGVDVAAAMSAYAGMASYLPLSVTLVMNRR